MRLAEFERRGRAWGWWAAGRIYLPELPEKLDRVSSVRGLDGSSYCPRYLGQLTLGSALPPTDPCYHLGGQGLSWPKEVSPG